MSELNQNLIGLARAREPGAWRELVRRNQDPVYRLALLLTGNSADAADIAQETFIRAYEHLHRFDPERPLLPWLLSIARRRSANMRRSAGRYLRTLMRLGSEVREDPSWQPEGALWAALSRLESGSRQVLYLRYFLGLSVADTAVVLGVAPGTVKSRHSRALELLQGIIADHFPQLLPEGVGNE